MYRSDVVGSLLRPAYLKAARERHEANQISDSEFKSVEDRAVDEAVDLQKRAGLEILTDGEMRRYAFFGGRAGRRRARWPDGTFAEALSAVPPFGAGPPAAASGRLKEVVLRSAQVEGDPDCITFPHN